MKPGVVVPEENRSLGIKGQPGYIVRPCLKTEMK